MFTAFLRRWLAVAFRVLALWLAWKGATIALTIVSSFGSDIIATRVLRDEMSPGGSYVTIVRPELVDLPGRTTVPNTDRSLPGVHIAPADVYFLTRLIMTYREGLVAAFWLGAAWLLWFRGGRLAMGIVPAPSACPRCGYHRGPSRFCGECGFREESPADAAPAATPVVMPPLPPVMPGLPVDPSAGPSGDAGGVAARGGA